ncbi:MAG: ATP-binding cassette domain-containing protein [Clostridiaceae bacterium]|jgi:ABC-type nitrate/sulfonate/bicarbonate transport system ATPase subunit|nr:ATP-binding cassette domain-containing protein [Clostridiaceae bacterium]
MEDKKAIILSCHQVAKHYGSDSILDQVNLTLYQGELVSVLGQSGSGKTTLFNILAGLDQADSGQVKAETKLGYMLQKDMLLPWKRLIDNVALPLVLAGDKKESAREKAAAYFETFGLEALEARYPHQLSGGQRRRAALLRTYLHANELMLLDEPFTGLDAISRSQLHDWLIQHKEALGLSILLITHDIEEALVLSDRIYVLSQGPSASLWPPLDMATVREGSDRLLDLDRLREEIRHRLFAPLPPL